MINGLSKKQKEFIAYGDRYYNVKTGARGGGKTYIDLIYTIGHRVATLKQYKGMFIMCGNTLESIEDNILKPMRDYWGEKIIPHRKGNNTEIKLFGQEFRLIGASSKDRVNILRGKNILYAYCDEVVTYVEDFFNMLTSGLRVHDNNGLLVSQADFTCNPENPTHWFKKFIDNQIENSPQNIFFQHYTIYDNTSYSKGHIQNQENLYRGTVYFDRWIKGLWVNAEGIIFRLFADNPNRYLLKEISNILEIHIGVDFGGNNSKTMFVATGLVKIEGVYKLVVLEEHHVQKKFEGGGIDSEQVSSEYYNFFMMIWNKYRLKPKVSYCDHFDLTIFQMINYFKKNNVSHQILKVDKNTISLIEYIQTIQALFSLDKLLILDYNKYVIESLQGLLYDEKAVEDKVLDDNITCDVDTYDALRYSISWFLKQSNLNWIKGV